MTKQVIGGAIGFLWFGLMTLMVTGGLLFWWLSAMRPQPGEVPTTEQQGVCVIWKDLGRPCVDPPTT
jgi:hypothetical protein